MANILICVLIIVVMGLLDHLFGRLGRSPRAKPCSHGILGDCAKCGGIAHEAARIAADERRKRVETDYNQIQEDERNRIRETVEERSQLHGLRLTEEAVESAVVKIYEKSVANKDVPLVVTGHSVRRGRNH